ncbi:MAG: SDR family oxidoreductase [Vibrio toranzoniae]|uniref:Short-chain dehydrogenase n=1 Tax=Vibrio toranzoniae TaxID=1194427 RepID=A0A109DAQ3_9VIBR|nr:SDR family oxidoreductase [Vibrio toranzoniae]KWU02020.1 short-chain dehydrogenase [Vibrio toranzoniae]NAZ68543.1 SDR family oxidoreductase [Vibrio toranzoniae]NAZ90818.1 SDR family oxidoreductase [Vibrio toranzoniae]SBS26898.1 short chain dehydrogenase [Vibrio toranzoniae]
MEIKSSIILVTSAGSRLGGTIANHFVNLGATVILCDKDPTALEETYLQCSRVSDSVYRYKLKDNHNQAILDVFDFVQRTFNTTPDVLVNNWISSPMPSLIGDQPVSSFIEDLSSKASTLFAFGQISAERLREADKEGVIVNVISHDDFHDVSGLESANSMITGFTHSWAKELTPFNIRVGGVVPAIHNADGKFNRCHWAQLQDELTRTAEYIISNDYFSGRVVAAEV